MTKRLLISSLFIGLMMFSAPANAMEIDAAPQAEQIDEDVAIAINGQTVTISGAQGLTMEVVSLTGRKVMTAKIESPAQRVELNVPKGCYILKVGKVVRKISVR